MNTKIIYLPILSNYFFGLYNHLALSPKQLLELLLRSRIVLGANDTPFPFNTAKKTRFCLLYMAEDARDST